jgi:predicted amidophosphoribosyltransferase
MDKIFVATKYSEVEKMVERFKYFSDREYVEVFGELLAKVVEQR